MNRATAFCREKFGTVTSSFQSIQFHQISQKYKAIRFILFQILEMTIDKQIFFVDDVYVMLVLLPGKGAFKFLKRMDIHILIISAALKYSLYGITINLLIECVSKYVESIGYFPVINI